MDRLMILVLEDKPSLNPDLPQYLSHQGFKVVRSDGGGGTEAVDLLQGVKPDLAIIHSNRRSRDLETVKWLRRQNHGTPVILIVQESSESRVIGALRAGINDYFKHPVSFTELLSSIRRHLPNARPVSARNQPAFQAGDPGPDFIGETPPIRQIKDYIARAAALDCNVLITGETGTGKEKVAELIHWQSARREHPMICINCAALPENLLESELFGFERGAFTGASEPYPGKLRLAEGGIIFLDEIFTMSPFMQAKLLRALDTRKIYSLGGRKSIPLNIRVVAATNQDPEEAMVEGSLRQDLFYRLNVARVHLPPLRERQMDIPLLLRFFLKKMNRRYGRRVESFSPEVMELLLGYGWPGNIRELRNLVEALFINLAPQARCVSLSHLPETFQRLQENLKAPQEERMQVLHALLATNWNKSEAAQKLRISRMTLYRKMEKHEIQSSQGVSGRPK
jgi:DNA-binding NtrC family response regulator